MKNRKRSGERMRWLCHASALATAMAVAPAALAQQQTHAFDIPSQSLSSALLTFGRQANLSLAAPADITTSHVSPAVQGQMTVKDALERLLAGSGLIYEIVNGSTVRIYAADQAIRTPAGGERRGQDRVIVTGTNIRGVYPDSSPVQVFTADDIARSGATTTEEFMRRLPQNVGSRTEIASGASSRTNREGVNGVDLRGLGVGTTLTLINGRRIALAENGQAVDISMIPVSLISRVEVLTDGASAIYGSDAVGGVVNFILRDDFRGAETRANYSGVTSGGYRRGGVTQTVGTAWSDGFGMATLDYSSASALAASAREFSANTDAGPGNLTPITEGYRAFGAFGHNFGERFSVAGHAGYSLRDVKNVTTLVFPTIGADEVFYRGDTELYFGSAEARYIHSADLASSLVVSYSTVDVDTLIDVYNNFSATLGGGVRRFDTNHAALDVTASIDGRLMDLPAGSVRFAFGANYLDESYRAARNTSGSLASGRQLGRGTVSVFGEAFVPILAEHNEIPFARRIELSLGARYTKLNDQSEPRLDRDFGSDFVPKIGLLWSPFADLNLRGTYGHSFRAPSLLELDPSSLRSDLRQGDNVGGAAATTINVQGPAPMLEAEQAETFTIGVDFNPGWRPSLSVRTTYYSIDYTGRIGTVPTTQARLNPSAWPELVWRPASSQEIETLLSAAPVVTNNTGISVADPAAAASALYARTPNLWIVEFRTRNLASSAQDGLDVAISDSFDFSWGSLKLGANINRILAFREQVSASAPVLSATDIVLRPADLKGRLYASVERGGFVSTLGANYVDDYRNPISATVEERVDSWTTFDWVTSYDFSASDTILEGVRLTLGATNLFDSDPPRVRNNPSGTVPLQRSPGFDPANADPFGRVVSVGITKRW